MEIFEHDFQIFTCEKVGAKNWHIYYKVPLKNGIFIIEKVLKIGMNLLLLTYYKFIIKYLANFFTSLLRAPENEDLL